MAYAKIIFENPKTGYIRVAPVGFSWTTMFFGFFPALLRGDWKWAAIMTVLAIMTSCLSFLVFMFIYNKLYIKDLIANGYKVKSVENRSIDVISNNLGIVLPLMTTGADA
jgi:hypothetical protein